MALGDVASWVGVTASVLMSGAALEYSHRSLKESRRSADAAVRAAAAAERQAIAAEKALPPPPPDVAWRIEHVVQDRFALRNVGVKPASGVKVSSGNRRPTRGHIMLTSPTHEPLPPEGSVPLLVSGVMGSPSPDELLVSWDGNPEGTWVAIPPKTGPSR